MVSLAIKHSNAEPVGVSVLDLMVCSVPFPSRVSVYSWGRLPTQTIGKIGYFPVEEMKRERDGTKKGLEEKRDSGKVPNLALFVTRKPSARVREPGRHL